jgi:hypothetical protein
LNFTRICPPATRVKRVKLDSSASFVERDF